MQWPDGRKGADPESEMIGYVTLGTNDLERASRFYDELLAVIGARRTMELDRGTVG